MNPWIGSTHRSSRELTVTLGVNKDAMHRTWKEVLAHRFVELHIYGIDELGELVTLSFTTVADLAHAYSWICAVVGLA